MFSGTPAVSAPAPTTPALPSYAVTLTSYNAVPSQTDGDPMTTASGLRSNPEVIAARSGDLATDLPFGTVIAIEHAGAYTNNCGCDKVDPLIGYRVVGDSMNSRFRSRVDVLLDQDDTVKVGSVVMNPSRALGVCGDVTVHVVGFMKLSDVPGTQAELVQMVQESAGSGEIAAL